MQAMKNQTKESMTEKYKDLHGMLISQGLRPKIQILYNEVLKVLLELMENDNVYFQLVSEHIHWQDNSE